MRLLDGLTARQAAARPAPGVHSIWEIVLHMTAWTREVTSRLGGAEAKEPADGDYPPVGAPTRARWLSATKALASAQAGLARVANRLDNDRWRARVRYPRGPLADTDVTTLGTLEGLALHHAYHGGQIGLLRRWLDSR